MMAVGKMAEMVGNGGASTVVASGPDREMVE